MWDLGLGVSAGVTVRAGEWMQVGVGVYTLVVLENGNR